MHSNIRSGPNISSTLEIDVRDAIVAMIKRVRDSIAEDSSLVHRALSLDQLRNVSIEDPSTKIWIRYTGSDIIDYVCCFNNLFF